MNTRQQLYKKHRLEGMSKYAAALKAGYAHNTALQAKNIEKYIKVPLETLAEMAGFGDKALIKYCVDRLNAMKPIAADVMIREENGKLKVQKNSNDWIDYPDYQAQHKFFTTLLELIGKRKTGASVNVGIRNEFNAGTNGKLNGQDADFQREMVEFLENGNGKRKSAD